MRQGEALAKRRTRGHRLITAYQQQGCLAASRVGSGAFAKQSYVANTGWAASMFRTHLPIAVFVCARAFTQLVERRGLGSDRACSPASSPLTLAVDSIALTRTCDLLAAQIPSDRASAPRMQKQWCLLLRCNLTNAESRKTEPRWTSMPSNTGRRSARCRALSSGISYAVPHRRHAAPWQARDPINLNKAVHSWRSQTANDSRFFASQRLHYGRFSETHGCT